MKSFILLPLLSLLSLLFTIEVWPAQGMVTVFEAPLFLAPPLHENAEDAKNMPKIIRYVKKGEILFVNDNKPQHSNFYQVLSKVGNPAYISRKFVKILYGDSREKEEPLKDFTPDPDPTDYRLEEPIPPRYPFIPQNQRQAGIAWVFGPSRKTNYSYPERITRERFLFHFGLSSYYTFRAPFDHSNRFYWGGAFTLSTSGHLFHLKNGAAAQEARGKFGPGFYISYDIYRTPDYLLTGHTSLSILYHRVFVTQLDKQDQREERLFTGFSLSSRLGGAFQFRDVFPQINLYLATEMKMSLPYTLSSETPLTIPGLWNVQSDAIEAPLGGNVNFLIGIQTSY